MRRLRRRALLSARAHCPFCFSDKTRLQQASGCGEIYTYSVMRRTPIPYAIAYVTLAEGPTMMTNIIDPALDRIRIGPADEARLQAERGRPAGADVYAGLRRRSSGTASWGERRAWLSASARLFPRPRNGEGWAMKKVPSLLCRRPPLPRHAAVSAGSSAAQVCCW